MCKAKAGPRCSRYAEHTLEFAKKRFETKDTELKAYEEKYADSLDKAPEEFSKFDTVKQHKYARLLAEHEDTQKKFKEAEFEYMASPVGETKLVEELDAAKEAGDEEKVKELETTLEHTRNYRQWQRNTNRSLKQIEEEDGIDAAQEEATRRLKALEDMDQEHATKKLELENDLATLEKEQEEDEEAEKAHEDGTKPLTDAELKKLRQRKIARIALISAAAFALLSYILIMRAATGQKSQLLGYAKSYGMRQGMQYGKKLLIDNRAKEAKEKLMKEAKEAKEKAAKEAKEGTKETAKEGAKQVTNAATNATSQPAPKQNVPASAR